MNLEGLELEDEDIATLQKSLDRLQKSYKVEIIANNQIPDLTELVAELKSYQILNYYKDFDIINIFQIHIGKDVFQIINVYLTYLVNVGKGQIKKLGDIQSVGLAILSVDFEHVLITPETTADKVVDFFLNREVDFETSKDFSDKFLLLTSNKVAVRHYFKPELLDNISKLKDIEIEIKGNKLIARFAKTITMTNSMNMAKLLEKVILTINHKA